jgi:hypothetical protein
MVEVGGAVGAAVAAEEDGQVVDIDGVVAV